MKEFELRLGKKIENSFDTNIGKTSYTQLKQCLDSNQSWKSVKHDIITDTFYGNVRESTSLNNDTIVIKKHKIHKEDILQKHKFDIRISVSVETETNIPKTSGITLRRTKERICYIHNNWQIDLSIVNQNDCTVYECELEYASDYTNVRDYNFLKNHGIAQLNYLLSCANI